MFLLFFSQISELNHVNLPVMLMPDDFKAFTKIRVDNHMFNKWVIFVGYLFSFYRDSIFLLLFVRGKG